MCAAAGAVHLLTLGGRATEKCLRVFWQAHAPTHLIARDDMIARCHTGHTGTNALHHTRRLVAQNAATRTGEGKAAGVRGPGANVCKNLCIRGCVPLCVVPLSLPSVHTQHVPPALTRGTGPQGPDHPACTRLQQPKQAPVECLFPAIHSAIALQHHNSIAAAPCTRHPAVKCGGLYPPAQANLLLRMHFFWQAKDQRARPAGPAHLPVWHSAVATILMRTSPS